MDQPEVTSDIMEVATTTENNEVVADSHAEGTVDTHEEVAHEVTLYAEPVLSIGGFNVTNSLINSWIVVFILVILAIAIARSIKRIPKGIQNAFEIIIEGAMNMADSVTGDRAKPRKYFLSRLSYLYLSY